MTRYYFEKRCLCKENEKERLEERLSEKGEKVIERFLETSKNKYDRPRLVNYPFHQRPGKPWWFSPKQVDPYIDWIWDSKFSYQTQIFRIKHDQKLSLIEKNILNSFQKKYLYHAIDDILEASRTTPNDETDLLEILYAPILSLHNDFSINFFDTYIQEIYLEETFNTNKFLPYNFRILEPFTYITIKILYKIPVPVKKKEILW